MGQVIINADDFGLTNGVNYGIIDSFLYGITTSTTLLANGAAFDHAVELASEHPDLEIGVHLNLTLGKPLLPGADSISANGRFHTREYVQQHAASLDLDEVYAEWHAQIEKGAQGWHQTFAFGFAPPCAYAGAAQQSHPVVGNPARFADSGSL